MNIFNEVVETKKVKFNESDFEFIKNNENIFDYIIEDNFDNYIDYVSISYQDTILDKMFLNNTQYEEIFDMYSSKEELDFKTLVGILDDKDTIGNYSEYFELADMELAEDVYNHFITEDIGSLIEISNTCEMEVQKIFGLMCSAVLCSIESENDCDFFDIESIEDFKKLVSVDAYFKNLDDFETHCEYYIDAEDEEVINFVNDALNIEEIFLFIEDKIKQFFNREEVIETVEDFIFYKKVYNYYNNEDYIFDNEEKEAYIENLLEEDGIEINYSKFIELTK